jgi:hypothetical protein
MTTPQTMASPPMVGVPALTLWLAGPSSRIGCPMPCFRNHLKSTGVIKMLTHSAIPPETPSPSTD